MLLLEKFNKEIAPELQKNLGLKNSVMLPRLQKIVVSSTTGEALQNQKILDVIASEIASITGQKPVKTIAKKSIATFKLRKGVPIGVMVTLRGNNAYEFFQRLVTVALPRSRDFRGLSKKAFDGRGNYNLGITEHIIFPEIQPEKIDKVRGLNITIVTSTNKDEQAYELLKILGFPFRT